jgi:hypothetical protein
MSALVSVSATTLSYFWEPRWLCFQFLLHNSDKLRPKMSENRGYVYPKTGIGKPTQPRTDQASIALVSHFLLRIRNFISIRNHKKKTNRATLLWGLYSNGKVDHIKLVFMHMNFKVKLSRNSRGTRKGYVKFWCKIKKSIWITYTRKYVCVKHVNSKEAGTRMITFQWRMTWPLLASRARASLQEDYRRRGLYEGYTRVQSLPCSLWYNESQILR